MSEDDYGIEEGMKHDMKFIKTFNLIWPHAYPITERLKKYFGDFTIDQEPLVNMAISKARENVMSLSDTLAFDVDRSEVMAQSFLSGLMSELQKVGQWRVVDEHNQMWEYASLPYQQWVEGKERVTLVEVDNIGTNPQWLLDLMLSASIQNHYGDEFIETVKDKALNNG